MTLLNAIGQRAFNEPVVDEYILQTPRKDPRGKSAKKQNKKIKTNL